MQFTQLTNFFRKTNPARRSLPEVHTRFLGLQSGGQGKDPVAETRYGLFFQALRQNYHMVGIFDVSLRDLDFLRNGLMNFHLDRRLFKEQYARTYMLLLKDRVSRFVLRIV